MQKRIRTLLHLSAALSVGACGGAPGSGPAPSGPSADIEQARSMLDRDRRPEVSPANRVALAEGNQDLAADLYRELVREAGTSNLFYSPHSVASALAMTYEGARGETADEMAAALRFGLDKAELHPAMNWLDLELAARAEAPEAGAEAFRLRVVNQLFGQTGYRFLPAFLDTLALHYGAGMRLLDFMSAPEDARIAINDWVASQTEDKIPELLGPDAVDVYTRLVLVNAVYFKAPWASPFPASRTEAGRFHSLDGSTSTVDMMRGEVPGAYGRGPGYQAFSMPYAGHALDMVVILPDADGFSEVEGGLDGAALRGALSVMQQEALDVRFPKFSFRRKTSLVPALRALGMRQAFGGEADFSGMDGSRDFQIGDVIHEAFVQVDEKGTEAAAATAIVVERTVAEPVEPIAVVVDRPFLFLIRDIETGAILFLGRVASI